MGTSTARPSRALTRASARVDLPAPGGPAMPSRRRGPVPARVRAREASSSTYEYEDEGGRGDGSMGDKPAMGSPGQGGVHRLLPVRDLDRVVQVDALGGERRGRGLPVVAGVAARVREVDGEGLGRVAACTAAVRRGEGDARVTGLA